MCKRLKTSDCWLKYLKKRINEYQEKKLLQQLKEIPTLITEKKQLKSTLRKNNSQRTYNNIISRMQSRLKTMETSIIKQA